MTAPRVDPPATDLGWLTQLARSLALDQNEADDLVQESWLIALARPPVSGRITQGWLATVIRNVQRLKLRTRRRERAREARVSRPESVLQGEHLLERLEVAQIVLREVKALDPIYREVVLYRYHWDLTPNEIAGQLDVSVATVHTDCAALTNSCARASNPASKATCAWPWFPSFSVRCPPLGRLPPCSWEGCC